MSRRSISDRARVGFMKEQGASDKEIMEALECSRHFVKRWSNVKENETFRDNRRSGRPRKLSYRCWRRIKALMGDRRHSSLRGIARRLRLERKARVHHSTIARILERKGFSAFARPRRVLMNAGHARKRLVFARTHKNEDWSKVVFSDEKIFKLYSKASGADGWQWAKDKSEVEPVMVDRWGPSVHVWGAISIHGTSQLAIIEKTLDATRYQNILDQYLLPAADVWFGGEGYKFEQDHARPHDANSSIAWLKEYVPDFFLPIVWPAKSPDLSPIENLWAQIDRDLDRTKIHTRDELIAEVKSEWAKVSVSLLQRLYASMPDRIKAVIRSNGWHTKY